MTKGEQLVWAAAYAARYAQLLEDCRMLGIKVHARDAVEFAWAAVYDMRESVRAVSEGWGEDSQQLKMLEEMLYERPPKE